MTGEIKPDEFPTLHRGLHIWGGIGTAIWLGAVFAYAIWKRGDFATLEANAMGDFFAGAFAPLAFLWLVLGFLQQGQELRHSAEALWLQGRELQNSVEQQRELVNVTREQLKFEGEVLSEQRAELLRKSRPILRLRTGITSTTGNESKVTFYLASHGRDCTDLQIAVSEVEKVIKRAVFPTGEEIAFRKRFETGAFSPTTVDVSYIDERLIEGCVQFIVAYQEGEGFCVASKEA